MLLLVVYSFLEFRWLKVTTVEIESADIPPSFDGKKIVFFSDVHHGIFFSRKRVAALVDKVNAQNPDIIIIGGDNVFLDTTYIYSFFKEVSRLKSRYGIFEVVGNHDCYTSKTLTEKMIRFDKFKDCSNKSYWVKVGAGRIKIGGLDDNDQGPQLPDSTVFDVKRRDFCILVSHRPGNIFYLNDDRVDLTLSGHTHGGQVTLFGLWAPVLPSTHEDKMRFFNFGIYQKYRYGLISANGHQSYVTSGVGGLIPFRFFCRPEIAVIELKRAKSPLELN